MTPMEILVVAGGLALGYWVVSKLIDDLNRDERKPLGETAQPDGSAGDAARPWHAVLGIAPEATPEEIRRAYEYLMQQHRSDRVTAQGEERRKVAVGEIEAAYERAMRARDV